MPLPQVTFADSLQEYVDRATGRELREHTLSSRRDAQDDAIAHWRKGPEWYQQAVAKHGKDWFKNTEHLKS